MSAKEPPVRGDLRRNLASSFGVQGLFIGLRIAQQLLLVPILIGRWGAAIYQDWLVISSAAALFSMLDAGLQVYFGNALMIAWSQGDMASFRRQFAISASFYLVVICFGAAMLAALIAAFDPAALLGARTLSDSDVLWTFLPLVGSTLCLVPFGLCGALYRVHADYVNGTLRAAAADSARGFGVCAVALLGAGPVVAGWCYLIIALLLWISTLADLRKRFGPLPAGLARPTLDEVRETLSRASLYLVPTSVAPLILNVPILLLGRFGAADGEAVAFSVARTYAGFVRQIVVQMCHPLGSEMARQQAMGDGEKLRRTYLAGGRLTSGLAGLLSGFTLAAAGPFIVLWTHGAVSYDPLLIAAFLLATLLTAPAQISQMLFLYNNRPATLVVAQSAYAGGAILLCVLAIPVFQAAGAAWGVGLAEALSLGLFVPFAAARLTGIGLGRYLTQGCLVAGTMFAGSWAVAAGLGRLLAPNSYSMLIVMGLGWAVIVAGPSFRVLLSSAERAWCVDFARRTLRLPV